MKKIAPRIGPKIAILILSSFLSAVFFSILPVFADDEKDLVKVYYTEPIGAGEMVYHITACNKTEAYAPMACSKELVKLKPDIFTKQCTSDDKKIKEGTLIKGCELDPQPKNTILPYPAVSVKDYPKKCKDEPIKQGYLYGQLYGIVKYEYGKDQVVGHIGEDKYTLQTTVAWDPDQTTFPESLITAAKGNEALPMYNIGYCRTFDGLLSGGKLELQGSMPEEEYLKDFVTEAQTHALELISAGCNNSTATGSVGSLPQATQFDENKVYTCTILERISGKTGTDILGKYISGIYKWFAGIAGIIAVLIMVYSGIQISTAGADTAVVDEAKKRIARSLAGLAILFLSGLILYTINPSFFTL